MSAVGFRPGQRVRFSSLALPTAGTGGTVVAAPTGGPSLRTDHRVLVRWDHHRSEEPAWSYQVYLVDEELYLAFAGRPLDELPWIGSAGEVQRWRLTAELRRRAARQA